MSFEELGIELDDDQAQKLTQFLNSQKAKEAQKDKELADLRKQTAMNRVGIDTTTPAGKFFADHYEGVVDDEVALRQAALDLNVPFIAAVTPTGDEIVDDGSTAARSALSDGGLSPDDNVPDPRIMAKEIFDNSLKTGSSRGDAMADAMRSRFISAYALNDRRGLIEDRPMR